MLKRFNLSIWVLGALGILLSGCGGGGGGGKTTFTAIADWTNFGTGLTGQSQKWSFYDAKNELVRTILINHDASGQQPVPVNNLSGGTYHLRVELFANREGAGALVGALDEEILVKGSKSYVAAVGTDVTTVKVTPTAATFKAGEAKAFYAAGYGAAAKATFTIPNGFTWQTLGGVATVNSNGLVQGVSAGSGSVVASHTASAVQGAATLTVQSTQVTTGKWTVLVYMNSANDLAAFSKLNVNQMERVAGNSDVRFVVQWKQVYIPRVWENPDFIGTRRYLVKPDNSNGIASQLVQDMGNGIDMGDKNTLLDFINWGKTFYPADRYVLVIWNHGNGWNRSAERELPTRAVSYDDETGNSIKTWEMAQALGSNHFDILAFDASLMQMIEVADEVRDHATYVVGSEESPPGAGYPYDLVFDEFRDNPTNSALNLSKGFVDGMLAVYGNSTIDFITQSVIETSQIPNLNAKISVLAQTLIDNKVALSSLVPQVRLEAQSYKPSPNRFYRDLWDVCDRLQTGTSIQTVKDACADVKAAVNLAIKWEGHNNKSPGSKGISIDFSPSGKFLGSVAADYAQLRFANGTLWDEWLTVAP